MSVDYLGTLVVYILGIGGDDVAADFAYDVEHSLIVVHGILKVEGRVVIFLGIGIVTLLERNNLLHQRMGQMMLEVGIVCIEISHG